jgi:hypothetical protein
MKPVPSHAFLMTEPKFSLHGSLHSYHLTVTSFSQDDGGNQRNTLKVNTFRCLAVLRSPVL